jgi:hypothetical protein
MALKAQRVDTWVAALEDKPGSLAAKLEALSGAGVNLQFIVARRAPEKPGTGVVFVTPIQGAAACRAAAKAGFKKTSRLHTVQIQGPDKAGEALRIARALAEKGLNLRGVSGAALGKQYVSYLAFDTGAQAAKALRTLRSL